PFLSEEDKPVAYHVRKEWSCCWLVDPVDGTQEFLQRSGEFSVNVALIANGEPVLGALAVPISGAVYLGIVEHGATRWRNGELTPLPPLKSCRNKPILAMSRRRDQGGASVFAEALNANPAYWCQGGALKFCAMAEGAVDVYPRFSPVSEWDVAAGHALLRSLGAQVYADVERPLRYNIRPNLDDVYFCACSSVESEHTVGLWAQSLREQGVCLTLS
ncbi:MAG: inositol monophosphatase family protein, partial [Gammaproteobacteria bacterium]